MSDFTTEQEDLMSSVYRVPPSFWNDHHSRTGGCPDTYPDTCEAHGPMGVRTVRANRSGVWVELDEAHVAELVSDATHYADPSMGYDAHLRQGAERTLAALARQGITALP